MAAVSHELTKCQFVLFCNNIAILETKDLEHHCPAQEKEPMLASNHHTLSIYTCFIKYKGRSEQRRYVCGDQCHKM